ncbi:3,4-dihydroxy 2-butanone 4-phosphate synthase [Vanrija albida]|uniref:3,4-dihydroxy-2-butanone 4-phosphate synthase n=1 Tax=Vanrija albida TaxID=181172 RepID=A0ABR3Q1J7_9TREE
MSAPVAVANAPTAIPQPFKFDPVEDAIAAIKNGEFVVVMDDEDRENEGDLICAASKITEEGMAFFVRWTSGYICIPMLPERLAELRLPALTATTGSSEDPKGTAYHLTIDANGARHPVATGISAHDRSLAARLAASGAGPEEFTRPGHLVPLRYTPGGTRKRTGHTEASIDLCYLAGEPPVALLCELVHPTDPKGTMARRDDSWRFAREWGLKIISIEDLQAYVSSEAGAAVPSA